MHPQRRLEFTELPVFASLCIRMYRSNKVSHNLCAICEQIDSRRLGARPGYMYDFVLGPHFGNVAGCGHRGRGIQFVDMNVYTEPQTILKLWIHNRNSAAQMENNNAFAS